MVDFSSLLKRPAGEAKKPPVLPAGDYVGLIKTHEVGDNNKNRTPYVRFHIALVDWPADAPEQWDVVDDPATGTVRTVSRSDVDLSKRQMRRDYFFTDDALWRLDDLIRSMGIESGGRGYEEILPEMAGQPVLVEVQQYMNQNTNEMGNQIGKLVGQS